MQVNSELLPFLSYLMQVNSQLLPFLSTDSVTFIVRVRVSLNYLCSHPSRRLSPVTYRSARLPVRPRLSFTFPSARPTDCLPSGAGFYCVSVARCVWDAARNPEIVPRKTSIQTLPRGARQNNDCRLRPTSLKRQTSFEIKIAVFQAFAL